MVRVENSQNQSYAQGSSQYSSTPSQAAQSCIAIETQTPQEKVSYLRYLEKCSFECRKLFAALHHWFKNIAPLFHPPEVKTTGSPSSLYEPHKEQNMSPLYEEKNRIKKIG